MTLEVVTVSAGGAVFSLWSEISIDCGAEVVARTASLVCADPAAAFGGAMPLMPDVPVVVLASGEPLVTGFVRDTSPDFDPESHTVRIGIVSKAVDAVEASIDHPTGRVENASLEDIAREFDPAGLDWSSDGGLPPEPWEQARPGASVWDTIEQTARARGVLVHDDGEGRVKFATKPAGRHAGGLAEGVNLISGGGQLTSRHRFDPVVVRGQASRGTGAAALRSEARASDPAVGRTRPKVIIAEFEPTSERLQARADWEVRRAVGRSATATVEVPGWRDAAGTLWTPNFLVSLVSPRLYLSQDMVISSVQFTQGDGGTRARLSLVDPRAFGGEDPQGESAAAWGVPKPKPKVSVS